MPKTKTTKRKKPVKSGKFSLLTKRNLLLAALIAGTAGMITLFQASAQNLPTSCPGFPSLRQQINFATPHTPEWPQDFRLSEVVVGNERRSYFYRYEGQPTFVKHQITSISPSNPNYTHSDVGSNHGIIMDYGWYFSNPNNVVQPQINYYYTYRFTGKLYVDRYNAQTGARIATQLSSGGPTVPHSLITYRDVNAYSSVTGPRIGPCTTSSSSNPPVSPNPVPETVVAVTQDGRTVTDARFQVWVKDTGTNRVHDYGVRVAPWPLNTGEEVYRLKFISAANLKFDHWVFPDKTVNTIDSGEFSSTQYDGQTIRMVLAPNSSPTPGPNINAPYIPPGCPGSQLGPGYPGTRCPDGSIVPRTPENTNAVIPPGCPGSQAGPGMPGKICPDGSVIPGVPQVVSCRTTVALGYWNVGCPSGPIRERAPDDGGQPPEQKPQPEVTNDRSTRTEGCTSLYTCTFGTITTSNDSPDDSTSSYYKWSQCMAGLAPEIVRHSPRIVIAMCGQRPEGQK